MDPFRLALVLVRLSGAIYLTIGSAWTVGSFAVAFLSITDALQPFLQGSPAMLLTYGLAYLIGGVVVIGMSRRIATFAARF
jgi:hypothetical protein